MHEKDALAASQGSMDRTWPFSASCCTGLTLHSREEKKRMLALSSIPEWKCLLQRPLNHPTAQWLFSVSCKLYHHTASLHRTDGKELCSQVMQISLALLKASEKYQFPVPDAQGLRPVVSSGVSSAHLHSDSCSIFSLFYAIYCYTQP